MLAKRIEELVIKKPKYGVYRLTSDVFAILASNEQKSDFIKNIKEISKIISSKAIRAKGREKYLFLLIIASLLSQKTHFLKLQML